MKTNTYNIDLCTEAITLDQSLANLLAAIPAADIRVRAIVGPGGGWPNLLVTIPARDEQALKEWYFGSEYADDSDFDMVDYQVSTSSN